jgi:hypothetical protein
MSMLSQNGGGKYLALILRALKVQRGQKSIHLRTINLHMGPDTLPPRIPLLWAINLRTKRG